MKRTPARRLAALPCALAAAVLALATGCPPSAPAPCASDADCGGTARCVVAAGEGACTVTAATPDAPDDEPDAGVGEGDAGEGEPAEGEGEPAEGEGEPAEGEGEPDAGEGDAGEGEPDALTLGRPMPGAARVVSGGGFTLRGAVTSSSRSSSSSFAFTARSSR